LLDRAVNIGYFSPVLFSCLSKYTARLSRTFPFLFVRPHFLEFRTLVFPSLGILPPPPPAIHEPWPWREAGHFSPIAQDLDSLAECCVFLFFCRPSLWFVIALRIISAHASVRAPAPDHQDFSTLSPSPLHGARLRQKETRSRSPPLRRAGGPRSTSPAFLRPSFEVSTTPMPRVPPRYRFDQAARFANQGACADTFFRVDYDERFVNCRITPRSAGRSRPLPSFGSAAQAIGL